jgi:hypothetical protein
MTTPQAPDNFDVKALLNNLAPKPDTKVLSAISSNRNERAVAIPEPTAAVTPPAEPPKPAPTNLANPEPTPETPKPAEPAKEPTATDPQKENVNTPQVVTAEEDEVPLSGETPEANLTALRKTFVQTKHQLKEKEEALTTLTSKMAKYEAGEELPEPIKKNIEELNSRVQTLEKYEKVVNLKASPEYQKKFVEPINDLNTKLTAIATDYNIPENVMKRALGAKSEADLNRFLSTHFDAVGALEVKGIIKDINKITTEASALENAPTEALQKIKDEAQLARASERKRNLEVIDHKVKQSWANVVQEVIKEGDFIELIPKEDDTAFNEKFVYPIHNEAAQSLGKIVKELVALGVEQIPDELNKALSKMVLLAHASTAAVKSRNDILAQYNKTVKNIDRDAMFTRPLSAPTSHGAGGAGPTQHPNGFARDMTSHEVAAAGLASQVLGKIGIK